MFPWPVEIPMLHDSHAPCHQFRRKLWICLDPTDLNKELKCKPYYSRSVDKLIEKLHGCKVFSYSRHKERLLDGHTSPRFKVFNLHVNRHGRFQWVWLRMGTVIASDAFQKKLDEIFHNVPGVTGIVDDMVIYGKSIEEHDNHFLNFLSIVRKNNLKLNASKLQFQLKEVSFFGHN